MTIIQPSVIDHLVTARGELSLALHQLSRATLDAHVLQDAHEHAEETQDLIAALSTTITADIKRHGANPQSGQVLSIVSDLRTIHNAFKAVLVRKSGQR